MVGLAQNLARIGTPLSIRSVRARGAHRVERVLCLDGSSLFLLIASLFLAHYRRPLSCVARPFVAPSRSRIRDIEPRRASATARQSARQLSGQRGRGSADAVGRSQRARELACSLLILTPQLGFSLLVIALQLLVICLAANLRLRLSRSTRHVCIRGRDHSHPAGPPPLSQLQATPSRLRHTPSRLHNYLSPQ